MENQTTDVNTFDCNNEFPTSFIPLPLVCLHSSLGFTCSLHCTFCNCWNNSNQEHLLSQTDHFFRLLFLILHNMALITNNQAHHLCQFHLQSSRFVRLLAAYPSPNRDRHRFLRRLLTLKILQHFPKSPLLPVKQPLLPSLCSNPLPTHINRQGKSASADEKYPTTISFHTWDQISPEIFPKDRLPIHYFQKHPSTSIVHCTRRPKKVTSFSTTSVCSQQLTPFPCSFSLSFTNLLRLTPKFTSQSPMLVSFT